MKILSTDLRGLPTYWIQEGPEKPEARPILLFLHGFPDDALAWSHQIEAFSQNYQVIAPFMPGVRDNHPVEGNRYELDSLCLDILQILKKVDPSSQLPIIAIGHDLGGALCYELKSVLGSRLKGQVFINSAGQAQFLSRYNNPRQLLKSYYMYLFQIPKLPEKILQTFFYQFLRRAHQVAEVPENDDITTRTPVSVLHMLHFYRKLFSNAIATLREVPAPNLLPTLFIWGEKDAFLEIPTQDEIEHFHKRAELRVLDGNHWIHRTHPQQVNAIIEQFVRGNL